MILRPYLRSSHASVELRGRLWVTGGKSGRERLSSTEFISTSGAVRPGPDLPQKRDDHCMVKLRDERVMILGGFPATKSVIIYNPNDKTFSEGPNLLEERISSACTVFKSQAHGGRQVVMIIGGSNFAEIWDYEKNGTTWEKSNYLYPLLTFMCEPYNSHR